MVGSSTVQLGSLLLLLLLAQAPHSQGLAQDSSRITAQQRHLTGVAEPELQYTLTMPVPTSLTSGVIAHLTIPNYMGKQPGAPSPIKPRQLPHRRNCDNPKPTFVLVPGATGSQLDGTQDGSAGGCAAFSSPRAVYPDFSWLKNLQCFTHMMSVAYDNSTGRYTNSSGTQLYPSEGGWPDGTGSFLLQSAYAGLWNHLRSNYGYTAGVDMFAAPYDWRMDYDGLEQTGQFDQIAARIAATVKLNCGQKAVVHAHSMGGNVMLHMLRLPQFKEWRQKNIKALILASPSLEGAAAEPWMTKITGVVNPVPAYTVNIPQPALAAMPSLALDQALYQAWQATPSFNMVFPMAGVMDKDHVLVRTPSRSYTVGQQRELLRDMGADMMADHLDKVQAHTRQLVEGGPVPGIQSFCVYSTAVRTPMTLTFASDIPRWRALTRPAGITWGTGDGTVDLRALRICSRVVQPGNIEEVAHPMVDHIGLNREPAGLAALDRVYAKVGMVKLDQKGNVAELIAGSVGGVIEKISYKKGSDNR